VFSFSKLQTCIQINKNIKVKNKHKKKQKTHKNKKDKSSLHHVYFHGGLFNKFSKQIFFKKKKKKKAALRLCVSLLV
jgi:hypothetical protein